MDVSGIAGPKESTCGTGTLGHDCSRRVRLSPNADGQSMGEEKANDQGSRNRQYAVSGFGDRAVVVPGSDVGLSRHLDSVHCA